MPTLRRMKWLFSRAILRQDLLEIPPNVILKDGNNLVKNAALKFSASNWFVPTAKTRNMWIVKDYLMTVCNYWS